MYLGVLPAQTNELQGAVGTFGTMRLSTQLYYRSKIATITVGKKGVSSVTVAPSRPSR